MTPCTVSSGPFFYIMIAYFRSYFAPQYVIFNFYSHQSTQSPQSPYMNFLTIPNDENKNYCSVRKNIMEDQDWRKN